MVSGGPLDLEFAASFIGERSYDFIIAVDAGVGACMSLSLRPDLLVGDFDTFGKEQILKYQAKTGLSMMTADKNAEKKVIAQELEEMGYTFGYATYWNANIVQELSNGRVEIANLHRADDGSFSLFKWSSMQRYYEPDYPQGKVFLLLTEEEEQGMLQEGKTVQEDGGTGHFGKTVQEDAGGLRECGLLRAGREVFRGSGYVVYEYEKNADFLAAAQEVFS